MASHLGYKNKNWNVKETSNRRNGYSKKMQGQLMAMST